MDPNTDTLRCVVLHRGEPPALEPDPWAGSAGARAVQLARAIATSDGWLGRDAALVVRTEPAPVIAALGRFDEAAERWLTIAAEQLATTLQRLVLLDHSAVEEATTRLAAALEARYGRETLRSFRYAPVPRGGLLVLGALAYLLELPRGQIETTPADANRIPADADRTPNEGEQASEHEQPPLVLVDDIAISGLRLSQTVARRSEPRLVIATLHAHPDLRGAFVAAHDRVEAFLAAFDLRDHAPAALGDGYRAWLERWRARAAPGTLWIGQPDHVVYPWNEPDLGVWNEVSGREEPGWSVVPPEHCLKRRGRAALNVQQMSGGRGRLRPHPELIAGEHDGSVVIGQLATDTSFALEGTAADIWRAIVESGDPQAATGRLARVYDADRATLAGDVAAFVAELREAELLVEADA